MILQRVREELRRSSAGALLRKSVRSAARRTALALEMQRNARRGTFATTSPPGPLHRYVPGLALAELRPFRERIAELSELHLQHRSDVLGLGWRPVGFDAAPPGFEGLVYAVPKGMIAESALSANDDECRRIAALMTRGYDRIDWHRDHRSGFRWRPSEHASRIRAAPRPGADIKMPWELARMQHLPVLAFSYALATDGATGLRSPERYAREFRDQVLDFLSTNPPSFGVNWACTMEVAIRAANWLVAHDLFRAFGHEFDEDFARVFTRSVYEHGRHCIGHLEYRPESRENHYLGDICGLLFCAAYLPPTDETLGWLAFALQELVIEVEHQFHEDGSNIEGSTLYHALSTEMVLYAALLSRSLPHAVRDALVTGRRHVAHRRARPRLTDVGIDAARGDLFPPPFWHRVRAAVQFLADIRRPDHRLPQIGDNDSGHFLNVWPVMEALTVDGAVRRYRHLSVGDVRGMHRFWDEAVTNRDSLCAIGECLFEGGDLATQEARDTPEVALVRRWVAALPPVSPAAPDPRGGAPAARLASGPSTLDQWRDDLSRRHGEPLTTEFLAATGSDLRAGLRTSAYPGIGVYVLSSPRLYLLVRCGEVGQRGRGGHAHNDQLSLELALDGKSIVADPGTYVYTPSPDLRNAFRSTSAHFTPTLLGQEQSDWLPGQTGLFSLCRPTPGICGYFSANGFVGWHDGFAKRVSRVVEILADRIRISDFGAGIEVHLPSMLTNGYGRWLR